MKQKLVVLTGAGISAESGIATFRDSDGLWHGHDVREVASPEGFAKNPALVVDFYNQRRKNILDAQPNAAHYNLASLQLAFDVEIITQNIDDLHERAGSNKVMHLHGEIFKMCPVNNTEKTYPIIGNMQAGQQDAEGNTMRPFIVWFGEAVPLIDNAMQLCKQADILVIIGTSLAVYPAASLMHFVPRETPIYVIDKKIPELAYNSNIITIEKNATAGTTDLIELLKKV